jgi:uncharacterized protein (DUF433 family)
MAARCRACVPTQNPFNPAPIFYAAPRIGDPCGKLNRRASNLKESFWLSIPIAIITMGFEKEDSMGQLDRITQRPDVMGGKACIRGMRVTVGMILGQIGAGHTVDELLSDYPYLEREDIMQALRYAAWRAEEREIMLATG